MNLETHQNISPDLCGQVVDLGENRAEAELLTTQQMAVDDRGLVHGGFVFGLADFAAMAAVNHPWVVLAAAESRFRAPVRVGETLRARATSDGDSRRPTVEVEVVRDGDPVAAFSMRCTVLDRHVLDTKEEA